MKGFREHLVYQFGDLQVNQIMATVSRKDAKEQRCTGASVVEILCVVSIIFAALREIPVPPKSL
jgi:hypothetical protein